MLNTLIDNIQAGIESHPDKPALTYLEDGWQPAASLTFLELDQKAKAIATVLRNRFPQKQRVLLVYPEGMEFLPAYLGCAYAGMVAVPVPFPDAIRLKRTLPRIQAILEDVQAPVILTVARFTSEVESYFDLPLLATDTLPLRTGESWQPAPALPDDLIHLQYTSGSITTPKGVMVSHRNLIQNIADADEVLPYTPESVSLVWMPHVHDFGLVEGLLRPFLAGVSNYVISPTAFIKRPIRWLQAITKYRVSHTGGANFAYDYCLDHTTLDERRDLDLSCWKVAIVGAEPVRPQTLIQFSEAFSPFGFQEDSFCPGYGLAEATLMLSVKARGTRARYESFEFGQNRKSFLASCGRAHGISRLLIVDPEKQVQLPDGQVGEIWASGLNITQGYWNRPEETQEVFQAYLENKDEGPFLRTGDLGLIKDGDLFITGRLKDLIILHGQNYYPQDIEWAIEDCHHALHGCRGAVFSFEKDGQEKIVVVHEMIRRGTPDEELPVIARAIQETIGSDFELPIYTIILIRRGDLLKTASGKIRRQACREAFLEGSLNVIFTWKGEQVAERQESQPMDDLTNAVLQIWRDLLKRQDIGVNDNFFAVGGDSLSVLSMTLEVEKQTSQTVDQAFFQHPTIAHLVETLGQEKLPPGAREMTPLQTRSTPQPAAGHSKKGSSNKYRFKIYSLARYGHWLESFILPVFYRRNLLSRPYVEANRWLAEWCRRPLVAHGLYQAEYKLFCRMIASLDGCTVDPVTAFPASIMGNILRMGNIFRVGNIPRNSNRELNGHLVFPYWNSLQKLIEEALLSELDKYFSVSGLEYLERAYRESRGVILLTYHSTGGYLAINALPRLFNCDPIQTISRAVAKRRSPDWQDSRRVDIPLVTQSEMNAGEALRGQHLLAQGKIIQIVNDGYLGGGDINNLRVIVAGRQYLLPTGFAVLALNTGASIIPHYTTTLADGHVHTTFLPPLVAEPGGRDVQIERLMTQYTDFLTSSWKAAPESMIWKKIKQHFKNPIAIEPKSVTTD